MEETKNPTIRKELVILVIGVVFVVSVSVVFALTRPSLVNKIGNVSTLTSTSTATSQGLQRTYCEIPAEGFPKTFGKYDYVVGKINSAAKYSDLVSAYNTADNTSNPTVIPLGHRATDVGVWDNVGQLATDVLGIVWGNCKYDLDLVTLGISSSRIGEIYINNKQQLTFLQYDERLNEGHTLPSGEYVNPNLEVTAFKIDLKTKKIISKNLVPFPSEIVKFPGNGDNPKYFIEESKIYEPATSKIFLSVLYTDDCFIYPGCFNLANYTEKKFETVDKYIGAYEYNFETNKLERRVSFKYFNKSDNSISVGGLFVIDDGKSIYIKEQRETLKKF